ncbi:MAG TPA: class I SAM-dependent methyltransferase [Alphaproteobacteria bacterium]|nr:class I SAM-dependent methyltransferase [Alphaproteobacteria bacterium]
MSASIRAPNETGIKEEDIRPDELFSHFMDLSAEDAETFFDRNAFVESPCPGCGISEGTDGFEKFSFSYIHCPGCGSLYASPRPCADELLHYYATSKSQTFWSEEILKRTGEKRRESIILPALNRVASIVEASGRSPRRVLDVGAATGAFLLEWKKRYPQADLLAIEPGTESARKCRESGITVFETFVEEEAEKGTTLGDLVTCFEVLEHVQDPERFARALCRVTAPGGLAILSCLGADGFDIQTLWEKSRSIMPPYHLNFLSRKGMEALFSRAGFDRVEILTPGRMDVQIVRRSMERGLSPSLSRFESLLLSRGEETLAEFQTFLARNGLSSHVWILCHKN